MEALILLTLVGIFWLVSSRRWRRRFVNPLAIALILALFVTSPLMVSLTNWLVTLTLPADTGEKVDAIVVLGRGPDLRNRRVELVEELWDAKRAPKIFASGMLDAREILEQLQRSGVPDKSLNGEACSQSTVENARYTSTVLYTQGIRKILLVTDPPHMLRSLRLFRSHGFTVIPYLSPLPSTSDSQYKVWITLREYVGLLTYQIRGEFRTQPAMALERPDPEIIKKFSEWNCLI